jgi:hypothetical protein
VVAVEDCTIDYWNPACMEAVLACQAEQDNMVSQVLSLGVAVYMVSWEWQSIL